jgi:hypothetical protein
MPRKSAAALLVLDPRGHRLQPPRGLSKAERLAFVAAVRSVRPSHFAAEDVTLLTAYASATVQERVISKELAAAETETLKKELRAAHGRVAGSLVRLAGALRLGAIARNPSRHRRAESTVEPNGQKPWEWEPEDEPKGKLN